jgi:hypothetical protein
MPTFEELSQQTSYPVLHTRRNDGVVIVATRVPLTDVRLQQWGWVLSQAYKVEQPSQDGFEGLIDSTGKRYSKIYTLIDMQHYIEQWGCKEWEVGYFAIGRATDKRVTIRLEDKIVQEDTFKNSIDDLKKLQEKQLNYVLNSIIQQEKNLLQGNLRDISTLLADSLAEGAQLNYTNQQKMIEDTIQKFSHIIDDIQDNPKLLEFIQRQIDELKASLQAMEVNVKKSGIEPLLNSISDSSDRIVTTIMEKLDQQPHLTEQGLAQLFHQSEQRQINQVNDLSNNIKLIQDNIAELQNILVPVDIDVNSSNTDDSISKVSANAKTLSERFIGSIITTNTRYLNTVDKQMKDSFKLTSRIILFGVCLFGLTIISLVATLFLFHSDEITVIASGFGAAASAIVTAIGGLNRLMDNANDRQLKALGSLSRTVKAAHSQFVIEKIEDDVLRKEQLEQLNKYILND